MVVFLRRTQGKRKRILRALLISLKAMHEIHKMKVRNPFPRLEKLGTLHQEQRKDTLPAAIQYHLVLHHLPELVDHLLRSARLGGAKMFVVQDEEFRIDVKTKCMIQVLPSGREIQCNPQKVLSVLHGLKELALLKCQAHAVEEYCKSGQAVEVEVIAVADATKQELQQRCARLQLVVDLLQNLSPVLDLRLDLLCRELEDAYHPPEVDVPRLVGMIRNALELPPITYRGQEKRTLKDQVLELKREVDKPEDLPRMELFAPEASCTSALQSDRPIYLSIYLSISLSIYLRMSLSRILKPLKR